MMDLLDGPWTSATREELHMPLRKLYARVLKDPKSYWFRNTAEDRQTENRPRQLTRSKEKKNISRTFSIPLPQNFYWSL